MRFVSAALWLLPTALGSPLSRRQESTDRYIIRAAPETSLSELRAAVEAVASENSRSDAPADIEEFSVGDVDGVFLDASSATPEALEALREVALVERDLPVSLFQGEDSDITVQPNASYALARVGNRFRPAVDYFYRGDTAGAGIFIYVVDSGVRSTHEEFGDRVIQGFNAFPNESIEDLNGHGTHVAASAAGTTFGVAKDATIIGVKCIDRNGDGSVARLIQCNEFVVDHARQNGHIGRAVVNYSLGLFRQPGTQEILDASFRAVVEAGLTAVVASGNSAADAVNFSPAGIQEMFTVGSTNFRDVMSGFSNFGPVVDVLAPGEDVTSAWIRSDSDVATISGTSMASPVVAGIAAYLMALEGLTTSEQVTARIIELSSKGFINNLPQGTPNRLAYNGVRDENGVAEPGFRGPVFLGNGSINAPVENCAGQRTLIGGRIWGEADGEFDIARCAQHCRETSAFEEGQGRETRCRFFNTYEILRDGVYSGQECALYTQQWEPEQATNFGQYQGSIYITIRNSFGVTVQGNNGLPGCQPQPTLPGLPPAPPEPETPPPPEGPVDPAQVCTPEQDDTCFERGERCAVRTAPGPKDEVCWAQALCGGVAVCRTDADCVALETGLDLVCVFEPTGILCPFLTMCVTRESDPDVPIRVIG